MASVELKSLTKRYGAGTPAVDAVSLSIAHGQLVCLLGPSGCGKTTTLRLIAGFIEPTDGEIIVGQRVVSTAKRTAPPETRNMSMIFQSYALWPHMTVMENVAYGLTIRKLDAATVRARVDKILAVGRLSELKERYPSELSGGQQQRVSLARALVVEPETLLMDEPLSNLDANLREEMRFEIRRLHDEFRTTTVYVTHDQSEAMTTADLIAVMNNGRIEQLGTPEAIYDRPRSEFVARFIGASNVLKGSVLDAGHLSVSGVPVAVTGALPAPGTTGLISVRQHHMTIATSAFPERTSNVLPATVRRQVFLGANRDYLLALADGTEVRVAAPADQNIAVGAPVSLIAPRERCLALAG